VHVLTLAAAIASMTAAFERGDLDEAARQGALAGPSIVERALASPTRATRLAAIVAAPAVEDSIELLPALARVAAGADRRTSIPAARAARTIALAFAKRDLADDLAPDDVQSWRIEFETIARAPDHAVEVRVAALETASALGGFDLAVLADPDPDVALAAAQLACVAHRTEVAAAFGDRLRELAKDRAAARDVEACLK
jgi:hypothetical protein